MTFRYPLLPMILQATLFTATACNTEPTSNPRPDVYSEEKDKDLQNSDTVKKQATDTSGENDSLNSDSKIIDPRIAAEAVKYIPLTKVNEYELDKTSFKVQNLAVGIRDYIQNPTPYISYTLPKDADYVQIIRCDQSADLSGISGHDLSSLSNVDSNIKSESDMYAEDYWAEALDQKEKCQLVSLGSSATAINSQIGEFLDAYAESGSHRYILRACVIKDRYDTDSERTIRSDPCSRFLAISNLEKDFVSKRSDEVKRLYKAAEVAKSIFLGKTRRVQVLADAAIANLDNCNEQNHQRAVAKAVRDSWAGIAAAVAELGFEIVSAKKSLGDGLKELAKGGSFFSFVKGGAFDIGGILASGEGFLFKEMFTQIASSSNDLPRQCYLYEQNVRDLEILDKELATATYQLTFYQASAELRERQADAVAGVKTEDIPPNKSLEDMQAYLEENGVPDIVPSEEDTEDTTAGQKDSKDSSEPE